MSVRRITSNRLTLYRTCGTCSACNMTQKSVWDFDTALFFGGLIIALACIVDCIIFSIHHPDMTNMRQLIEYPEPRIIGCVACIASCIGVKSIGK